MATRTFFNVSLFDGRQNGIREKAWLAVDLATGQLVAIGGGVPPAESDELVDMHDQYVMPGFLNVHTHIAGDPRAFDGIFGSSEAESAVFAYRNLRELLQSGVTFARGLGTSFDVDLKLKKMMRTGDMTQIPHFQPSGKAFVMTGGHGDHANGGNRVDSPDEMRKGVRQALKVGAEVIKMMATGGVMSPGDFMDDPQLSVDEMHAGVLEAHHKGFKAAAHAEGNPGIQNAIDAGVDSIEHGFYVTESEARQMVEQDIYLTPTLVAEWAIPEFGQGVLPDWEVKKAADALEDTYVNLRKAYEIGVKFTCGTDAGTPFNGFDRTPEEFELLTKVGMTPFEAYTCSSLNAAGLCGVADRYGTLEVGKQADFQVLSADPLADVKAVQQRNKAVYLGGERQF
ncbi:amidohydrolase family protein [uncultured Secundilactobacillus sp.]|uniref:metal-dependent hydrolase family protein n=1 Tax=uncultured Secundilactobacillus sp. TaxID=2813935 RepID=UPI002586060C|nr:amidohydrolase family protein [uncultured Secundilactobacillus sp.]